MPSTAITQSYLVAATPRSGSTLLCDLFSETRVAGAPDEHFAGVAPAVFCDVYASALSEGTTPNGVFATKVMWHDLPTLIAGLRSLPQARGLHARDALAAAFPDLRYVQVLRRDKVAQAVALWATDHDGYDFDGIEALRERLALQERAWSNWFKAIGARPVTVVYEDLLRSPRRTAHAVLAELDLEPTDVTV